MTVPVTALTGWLTWLGLALGCWPGSRRRPVAVRSNVPAPQHRAGALADGRTSHALALLGALLCAGFLISWAGRLGQLTALPAAALAGWLIHRVGRQAPAATPDPLAIALVLDLLACALTAGAPPDLAIESVASAIRAHGTAVLQAAAEPVELVGQLLRLGSDPVTAWTQLDEVPGLTAVAAAGRRCAHSGARLASALADTATELRADAHDAAIARAQRTGVWTLLPLGCCFLPAFVCLGVLPDVLGVAGQVLGHG